ncbi:MAG TPA: hypothetical protein VMZ90_03465, partial [Vicinamibacterales bacterium]|nr:hypothetical protein [Vicinamibacterales bacterium]
KVLSFLVVAAVLAPVVHADVKTTEKTQIKLEGMLGRIAGMAGGGAGKDGVTNTVAVKGNRMATFNDQSGQIVDLSEQKVYVIDFKKKQYEVVTFAEMREQMKKAQADAEKAMKDAKDVSPEDRAQMAEATKNLDVTFDVKQTGEARAIAGHQAKQVIVTVTMKEKGKAIEESGGMVITNEVWLGPRIAALNEVGQFSARFFEAVYGESLAAMGQQFASLAAMYPGLQNAMKTMGEQMKKLDGTPLMTIQKTETVKSAAAMAQASAPPASGGGLSGALARRVMGNKKPEQRGLLYTSTSETLSIDTSATDADVAIPAGFKEKK